TYLLLDRGMRREAVQVHSGLQPLALAGGRIHAAGVFRLALLRDRLHVADHGAALVAYLPAVAHRNALRRHGPHDRGMVPSTSGYLAVTLGDLGLEFVPGAFRSVGEAAAGVEVGLRAFCVTGVAAADGKETVAEHLLAHVRKGTHPAG